MKKKVDLILASGSKQRKDIFDMIGWKYEIIKSLKDEKSTVKIPEEYVVELSKDKASSVALQINKKALIVAADTIIYMDGKIYEKPKNKEEAFNNIKEIMGKSTSAITGTTIKDLYQEKEISFCDKAEVKFKKDISDDEIRWYVENEEAVLNTCGYCILGKAAIFLDSINGDYNTVFGISPSKLYDNLKALGYKLEDFELK